MAAAAVRKPPADAAATGADALGHAESVKRAAGPALEAATREAAPAREAATLAGAAKAAVRVMLADAGPRPPASRFIRQPARRIGSGRASVSARSGLTV